MRDRTKTERKLDILNEERRMLLRAANPTAATRERINAIDKQVVHVRRALAQQRERGRY